MASQKMNAFIFWSVQRFFAVRLRTAWPALLACPEAVACIIQATAGSCLLLKLRSIRHWRGPGCNLHPGGVWGLGAPGKAASGRLSAESGPEGPGKAPSFSPLNFCFQGAVSMRDQLKQLPQVRRPAGVLIVLPVRGARVGTGIGSHLWYSSKIIVLTSYLIPSKILRYHNIAL